MSDIDLTNGEKRRLEVAEYVLGVLEAPERGRVERAIESDPALAAEARFWESGLSGFNDTYAEVSPPLGLLARIEAQLFAPAVKTPPWYEALFFWRAAAGLAFGAAALAIGLYMLTPAPAPQTGPQLVAALQPVESDLSIVVLYEDGALRMSAAGSPAGEDSDYELWFIEGENAPISMGVFEVGEVVILPVDGTLRERFAQGITLAVTREIAGGAPGGVPAGPIVAAGVVAII